MRYSVLGGTANTFLFNNSRCVCLGKKSTNTNKQALFQFCLFISFSFFLLLRLRLCLVHHQFIHLWCLIEIIIENEYFVFVQYQNIGKIGMLYNLQCIQYAAYIHRERVAVRKPVAIMLIATHAYIYTSIIPGFDYMHNSKFTIRVYTQCTNSVLTRKSPAHFFFILIRFYVQCIVAHSLAS